MRALMLGSRVFHRRYGYRAEVVWIGRLHCVVRLEGGSRSAWRIKDVSRRAPWAARGSLAYLHEGAAD